MRAAARVFAAKGFHQAKVEEIAAEAEVGKGTVYEYFSSKKELFQEMFKSSSIFYLNILKRKLDEKASITEKFRQIVYIHLKFIRNHKDIAKIILREHIDLGESLSQWMIEKQEEKIAIVRALIQEGMDRGEFRQLDPNVAARLFFGAVVLSGQMMLFEQDVDIDDISDKVMEIFLHGIKRE